MANLAIIPARGGSKRIPGKNIIDFMGRPIISYSIAAALGANCFDEVMVSTDNKKIARVANKYGASVPFMRSKKNSSDKATLVDVCLEVLEQYKKQNKEFEFVCLILPASPLILPERIKEGFSKLKKSRADVLMPVIKFSYPIERAFKKEKGRLKMVFPKNMFKNSQQFSESYHDSGQFYWFRSPAFMRNKKLFSPNMLALEIPESEAQDIDNKEDLKIAELKYKILFDLN
jgi:N-acylneuraminate cytidylyltransferase